MIICMLCKKQFKSITNTHLKKEHNISLDEYRARFGEIFSSDTKQRRREVHQSIDWDKVSKKATQTKRERRFEKYGDLTPRQLQICYGGLLGDFGIHAYTKVRLSSNYLECYHGEEQVPYLKWIQQEFASLDCRYNEWTKYWKEYNREYTRYWIETVCHPTFTDLRKEIYEDGGLGKNKIITREWLDRIEPLGLAVWYMDDGTFHKQAGCYLCTDCFSYQEHKTIQEWFKDRWGVDTNIYQWQKYWRLQIPSKKGKNRKKFLSIVKKHLLPIFEYKLTGQPKKEFLEK